MLDKLQSGTARQHPVQQDQIGPGFIQLVHRAVIIFRFNRLEAILFKHEAHHFTDRSFIFYDQNTSRHTLPCLIVFKLQVCNAASLCVRFMTDL
ncbi:Uncharacterised protein [Enterobacter cloacae]|nr:Uncharacterised protein [Enterobacter cloacae]SAF64713.1 Uncharacterised protein [Enterobacter cloacae]